MHELRSCELKERLVDFVINLKKKTIVINYFLFSFCFSIAVDTHSFAFVALLTQWALQRYMQGCFVSLVLDNKKICFKI